MSIDLFCLIPACAIPEPLSVQNTQDRRLSCQHPGNPQSSCVRIWDIRTGYRSCNLLHVHQQLVIATHRRNFCPATATNHSVIDAVGNSITVRNSAFATFATEEIPSENGKIRGVLTKYNGTFQLMLRTLNDVKLTNPRLNPAVENFESYNSGVNTFPNYFNLPISGTNDWFVGSFSGNKYLQARKSNNTGATRIFFVMPFDFDEYTKVSFKTLYGYMSQTSTPIMKVYYSTNFNSANPTANLVDITSSFTFSNHTGTGWASTFTNSGVHTFTGMSGQGHIIFAYDVAATSTTNAETRPGAQIDDILFQ